MLLNKSVGIAFCGIITALSTVLMMCTGLLPVATYALPALSGVLMILVVVELGRQWAFPVFVATALLSSFLAADKEAVLLFIVFFGYYPILKSLLEQIRQKWLSWLLKFIVFNAAMITGFFAAVYLLMVPIEEFTIGTVFLPWILLILGNIVFLLYDYAVSGLVVLYFQRFHGLFSKWLHKK